MELIQTAIANIFPGLACCSNDFIDHVSLSCCFFHAKEVGHGNTRSTTFGGLSNTRWSTEKLGAVFFVLFYTQTKISCKLNFVKSLFRLWKTDTYRDAGCWTFVGIVSTYGAPTFIFWGYFLYTWERSFFPFERRLINLICIDHCGRQTQLLMGFFPITWLDSLIVFSAWSQVKKSFLFLRAAQPVS